MKTAIITGASVGIGAAAAARFVAAGYGVYNLSRRPCPVAGSHSLACDLSDSKNIEAALAELIPVAKASSSVALVHNACQMLKDSADNCADENLVAALQTNVVAANTINQALLPVMPQGSSVLYVGSTLSEKAVPGSFSYVVSKHAVVGMMRATCQDLMGRGIHTACICPGFTDTEMLRTHLGNDEALIESIASLNSFNRLIDPDEIASLVCSSHDNPVINGSVLHAHLGQREA
ncbi:MAG: SDR family oxidoreductase [Halieaceae bacterium]|jgi:NAD(P)-dependent dehydrogenase (short-subunit alcohol dehydrogenase family)|nr:SDR family oxidoreductase [Halieaceae bacterium]